MKISSITAQPVAPTVPSEVASAAAVLNSGSGDLTRQLQAYQSLAGRWRDARPSEREALAPALTTSPFAQRVQSTLNAFTRAAWAGPDAAPPEPQARMLKAFDGLSEPDQQIVAAMQADSSGAPAFASAADYRAHLQADLEANQPAPERRGDSVTLSDAAQARLAGAAPQDPPAAPSPAEVSPEVATAIAAYSKATSTR